MVLIYKTRYNFTTHLRSKRGYNIQHNKYCIRDAVKIIDTFRKNGLLLLFMLVSNIRGGIGWNFFYSMVRKKKTFGGNFLDKNMIIIA